MVYRVAGGIFLLLLGLDFLGVGGVPSTITGIVGVIAGIALLAGL